MQGQFLGAGHRVDGVQLHESQLIEHLLQGPAALSQSLSRQQQAAGFFEADLDQWGPGMTGVETGRMAGKAL